MGPYYLPPLFSYGKPSIHQPYELYVRFHIQWPYIQWISTVWNQPYENNVTSSTAHIIFIRLSLSNTCIRVWHQLYGNKLCLGMGPSYRPHSKKLHVFIEFMAIGWPLFQKPGFLSGLNFWKSGLEGSNRKNKATFIVKTFWAPGMKVVLFFPFSASRP